MISNNWLKHICFIISVFSLVIICLLYFVFYELEINLLEFLRNLFFSIFGSALIAGITSHICIKGQIKEIQISIVLKAIKAYHILDYSSDEEFLKKYPVQELTENYAKVRELIRDMFHIMHDFQLRNNSRLPWLSSAKNVSIISVIESLTDANQILKKLYEEISLPYPNDMLIFKYSKSLNSTLRNTKVIMNEYLSLIFGKHIVIRYFL